jgi:hypothetical protein
MMVVRKQRVWGVALGALLPIAMFFFAYKAQYSAFSLAQYLQFLMSHGVLSKVMSLCVVPNLLAFFIAISASRDSAARGVLLSTVVLALVVTVAYFLT